MKVGALPVRTASSAYLAGSVTGGIGLGFIAHPSAGTLADAGLASREGWANWLRIYTDQHKEIQGGVANASNVRLPMF